MSKNKNKRLLSSYFFVTISISIVLYIMGAFFLLAFNAKKISNDFKEKIPITIYLKDSAKKIEIAQIQKKIRLKDYTSSMNYISKEKGAEILIEEIEENFLEFLGTNPILNSIDIYLKSDFVKSDILNQISKNFSEIKFVDEVRYDAPLVSLINENLMKIKFWVLIFASFFLVISILIINSSIRLSIYSNRMIIKTMQLVGATKKFIRKPFINTHIYLGIISSFIAISFLSFSLLYIEKNVIELNLISEIEIILGLFTSILLFSIVITSICTYLATQRFLKLKIDQLY
ncbi:MAG: permease-like cell division protein FtsX [Flavobacteriaceae bacterium]|nr:permease-like cell division protein FtsX [Flavobacteriaceae bacterium]MDG2367720.1 permease-like cell division protein FtsX [Flavobacteriaceae bacterium]